MKKSFVLLTVLFFGFSKSYSQASDSLKNKDFLNEKVNIAGIEKGEISKDILLASKGLSFQGKASAIYHITSFRLTVIERKKRA
jgi:hypothetical protein